MTRSPLPPRYRARLASFGLEDLPPGEALLFTFEAGEYLCHEGEPPQYLQIICEGTVKISVTAQNGRKMMFCFDTPGDLIGSIELLSGMPYTATAQTVGPVACIAVPIARNITFFKNNLAFLRHLATDLSEAFARSSKNAATNILHPLRTRLCSYILMTAQNGLYTEALTTTSELLGTSYRHLLRCLEQLCKEGVLEKLPQGYGIKDAATLGRLAEDYYLLG